MAVAPESRARSLLTGVTLFLLGATWAHGAPPPADPEVPADPFQEDDPFRPRDPFQTDDSQPDIEEQIRITIDTLLRLGLADPRGLPYCHVTVSEGGEDRAARGWVLPAESEQASRQAIGWNGLLNPVVEVGKPANLDADLAILGDKGWFCEKPFDNYQEDSLEDLIAKFEGAPRMMHPWAAPYLMVRLGHPIELDEDFSDPFAPEEERPANAPPLFPAWRFDPFDPSLILNFARHLRDDGVAAYCDRDDHLAAARLRQFDRVWAELEKTVRHGQDEEAVGPDPFSSHTSGLRFNLTWRELLLDARRRIGPRPEPKGSEVEKAIASWDELDTWEQDAPPAAFRAVVAAGPAAIDPLLDCLENDDRWTRVRVKTGSSHKLIFRVRDLAIRALNEVLQFPVVEDPCRFAPVETRVYKQLAVTARAFCERHEFSVGGELWYRLLAGDEEDVDFQVTAALAIVTPEDCGPYYGITDRCFFRDTVWDRYHEVPRTSREGLTLRGRSNPTVLELFEHAWQRERVRVEAQLAAGKPESTFPVTCGHWPTPLRWSAHLLVRCMEEWQPGNVEVLKAHYGWLMEGMKTAREKHSLGEFELSSMCEETLIRRFWAEDDTAMADYGEFFRTALKSGDLPADVMQALPRIDGMDDLANEAFVGPEAPLSFTTHPWTCYDSRRRLIATDSALLVLPSFRKAILEGLRCRTVQGSLSMKEREGTMTYLADGNLGRSESFFKDAAVGCERPEGTLIEVRVCDLIAYHITCKHGPGVWTSPSYRIDDPLEDRDRAIARWIAVLEKRR